MNALAGHNTMSKQALESEPVRDGLREILPGPAQLYEVLLVLGGSGEGESRTLMKNSDPHG